MDAIAEIRPSPIAGTWYTDDPARLRAQVNAYLDQAQLPALDGEVLGVVTPHAGLRYSGHTAGHAFAAVRGRRPALVAVVSPLHAAVPGTVLTTAHRAYATPLGPVWVDQAVLQTFHAGLETQHVDLRALAYDGEHSLEIELPFLQVALAGEFHLLPLMLRSQSPAVARQVGHALAAALAGRDVLLVASSDLSHFYSQAQANQLDAEMLKRMESMRPEAIFEAELTGQGFACGAAAVAAVLWAAQELGAERVQILHHSTSADETGDRSSVVGYGAAAILKPRTLSGQRAN
jgi:AmmeMemoRadiSam system protein B